MPNTEPGIQDNLKTPLHFFGTNTLSKEIVNVNKKKKMTRKTLTKMEPEE